MIPTFTVSQRIKDFNAPLLQPIVQRKYQVMAQNAYIFFRGTCHLFYEDLSGHASFPDAPPVWGCGDLHLENFGSYKGNNRYVYFDENDFDEALLLPATWEVVRVVTSILVAFKSLNVNQNKALEWAGLYIDWYSAILKTGKAKHIEARLAEGIVLSFLEQVSKRNSKALLQKNAVRRKRKYTLIMDDKRHCLLAPALKEMLIRHMSGWLTDCHQPELNGYKVIDAVFHVAGTGSLGAKRYLFLLQQGNPKATYLLLDMKEARPSSVARYTNIPQPQWLSEAERTVAIQTRTQYATAALLSTTFFEGASFTIQEQQPEEDKIDFTMVIKRSKNVSRVIKDMAMLTASAQLRSSGRQGSAITDELMAFGNSTEWQTELLQYALQYAGQVEADYQQFRRDYKDGSFKNTP